MINSSEFLALVEDLELVPMYYFSPFLKEELLRYFGSKRFKDSDKSFGRFLGDIVGLTADEFFSHLRSMTTLKRRAEWHDNFELQFPL